jgi:hypothetical protein
MTFRDLETQLQNYVSHFPGLKFWSNSGYIFCVEYRDERTLVDISMNGRQVDSKIQKFCESA